MKHRVVLNLFFVLFCLLGVMQTPGLPGAAILERVTLADLMMLLIAGITFAEMKRTKQAPIPSFAVPFLSLMAFYAVGAIFSLDSTSTMVEVVGTLYSFLYAIVILYWMTVLPDESVEKLIRYWLISVILVASLCLLDWSLFIGTGWRVFPGPPNPSLAGLFRNSGQAGHFFLTSLTFLIPLCFTAQGNQKNFVYVATVLAVIALIVTFKRSSQIGLLVGIICLVLFGITKMERRVVLAILGASALAIALAIPALMATNAGAAWRITSKFDPSSAAELSEGFIGGQAIIIEKASLSSPVYGIGLNATAGLGETHEVHSTYLGIFVYGGVIALAIMMWFLLELWREFARIRDLGGVTGRIGRIFLCLLVGLMVSWFYTYPLRKREFWLVTSIVLGYSWMHYGREKVGKCHYQVEPNDR